MYSALLSMSHRHHLRIGAININSNRSSCYDSKVQHSDFTDLTHDLGVIGITETHSAVESDVQKQGYKHYAIVRKKQLSSGPTPAALPSLLNTP